MYTVLKICISLGQDTSYFVGLGRVAVSIKDSRVRKDQRYVPFDHVGIADDDVDQKLEIALNALARNGHRVVSVFPSPVPSGFDTRLDFTVVLMHG